MGYNSHMNKKKITIIGAGISGLYLGYLLKDTYDITILEARNRVGGRIYSISGNDMGPSWIWSHQKNVLKLIKELGLELFTQFTDGNSLYDTNWKEKGLSGFTFSQAGPLGEIHDASEGDKHALFGFVAAQVGMQDFELKVKEQMIRLFDINENDIKAIFLVDWREEQFSSSEQDKKPLSAHSEYGIDTSEYSEKVLFGATEFSYDNGGYIEGAIALAQKISEKLHNE
ncbi:MAG: hypothetical protein SPLUMA2_SPLUMAMAG2_00474 [uncultured Sulfurimonas sp.]|nr:MAG: hypothetical protein SPLUMA2_SPLUMAMAG2_00474 [uncultured Sulfurimonas sp.]